jgi:fused signal recognition particle receptor
VSETQKKPGILGRMFGRAKTPAAPEAPETAIAQDLPDVLAETLPEPEAADAVSPDEAPHAPGSLEDYLASMSAPKPAEEVVAEAVAEPADAVADWPVALDVAETSDAAPTPDKPLVVAFEEPAPLVEDEAPKQKLGWFQRLTEGLRRTQGKLSDGITGIFTKRRLDADSIEDLEDLLLQADLGVETSTKIIGTLSKTRLNKSITPDEVRTVLAAEIEKVLTPVARPLVITGGHKPHVILVVGVNGGGKTTTIGKLAKQFRDSGRHVMLAAGDTFRAAAIEQLKVWGERTGCAVVASKVGADSSGVAFDALTQAKIAEADILVMDTAGRLQNKQALMDELDKVIRVLRKIDPTAPHDVLLVLDATTGQNAVNQVEVFRDRAGVTGLVMTKLDGTARGGILVAIAAKFGLPVHAIGVGESVEDLQAFDPGEFARAITLG